jgi:hypothetical protein
MRILMVNDYFGHLAGAFTVAWEMSAELLARGHEVAFLCATDRPEEVGRAVIDGRAVTRFHLKTPPRLRPLLTIHRPGLVGRALKAVEEFRPDVIHGHVLHLELSFGLAAASARRGWPVVLTAHDTGIFCPTKYVCQPPQDPNRPASARDCARCLRLRYLPGRASLTTALVNRRVKEVVAVSAALAGILRANGVRNVAVIHNGLDPDRLAGQGWSGERFRAEFSLCADTVNSIGSA